MSFEICEIEDFELSLTSNTAKGTIETIDSTTLGKKSQKTSLVYEHCYTNTKRKKRKARIEIQ